MGNGGFRTGLVIGGLAAAVVGLALALILTWGGDGGGGDPGSTATATTTVATTTERTATEPDGDEFSFASPTRNIVCRMTATEATCGILEFSFDPPPDPGNCGPGRWGHVLRVDAEAGASFICANDPPAGADAQVLDYGEYVRLGAMECGASRIGVYCESRQSHKGFAVSRERYGFG